MNIEKLSQRIENADQLPDNLIGDIKKQCNIYQIGHLTDDQIRELSSYLNVLDPGVKSLLDEMVDMVQNAKRTNDELVERFLGMSRDCSAKFNDPNLSPEEQEKNLQLAAMYAREASDLYWRNLDKIMGIISRCSVIFVVGMVILKFISEIFNSNNNEPPNA